MPQAVQGKDKVTFVIERPHKSSYEAIYKAEQPDAEISSPTSKSLKSLKRPSIIIKDMVSSAMMSRMSDNLPTPDGEDAAPGAGDVGGKSNAPKLSVRKHASQKVASNAALPLSHQTVTVTKSVEGSENSEGWPILKDENGQDLSLPTPGRPSLEIPDSPGGCRRSDAEGSQGSSSSPTAKKRPTTKPRMSVFGSLAEALGKGSTKDAPLLHNTI